MNAVKIGEFFGAKVMVSIYVDHDTIWISPKEQMLFCKLIELEQKLREQGVNKDELKQLESTKQNDQKMEG